MRFNPPNLKHRFSIGSKIRLPGDHHILTVVDLDNEGWITYAFRDDFGEIVEHTMDPRHYELVEL